MLIYFTKNKTFKVTNIRPRHYMQAKIKSMFIDGGLTVEQFINDLKEKKQTILK